MREIIFRGKSVDSDDWIYGWVFKNSNKWYMLPLKLRHGCHYTYLFNYAAEVDPETIGQFTGYIDKNSRYIYEGDVVNISGKTGQVVYKNGAFCITFQETINFSEFAKETTEIIEDKFRNSELLEV